ncbi:hypothetical protein Dsin_022173 [Dipteronia sinensis]|uniref:Uncharacterized protein n=1 Tax=Dipteronia sinensis TaxID=43782 RepID=A0AAE0DZJ2_9ROSI|nr:hypothetical protein Dsin_022173 [Dipteronia sinensis]
MGFSSVISPEVVLESLMNDGTIDSLRLKIINQLKANELSRLSDVSLSLQISNLWPCSAEFLLTTPSVGTKSCKLDAEPSVLPSLITIQSNDSTSHANSLSFCSKRTLKASAPIMLHPGEENAKIFKYRL